MTKALLGCPRCQWVLNPRSAGSLSLHLCHHCGGIWAQRLTPSAVSTDLGGEALAADREAAEGSEVRDVSAAISCPECAARLERVGVSASQVAVDICREHGVWFDRSEIEAIHSALGFPPPPAPRFSGAAAGLTAAGAGVAGVALAASAVPAPAANAANAASGVGEAVAEVAIELVIGFIGEVIGGLFS